MNAAEDETPMHERKRLRLEAPRRNGARAGDGSAMYAPKKLPFVSPDRQPQSHAAAPHRSMTRTPLEVRAAGRSNRTAIPSPVQDHMRVTRKKVRSSINAHRNHAMQQLERQYQALREKILVEIGDAEEQFKVLQQANESINEKTERKLKALTEDVATEITKIEEARATAISSTAQLYTKEKQKILQRFDAEIDALAA